MTWHAFDSAAQSHKVWLSWAGQVSRLLCTTAGTGGHALLSNGFCCAGPRTCGVGQI